MACPSVDRDRAEVLPRGVLPLSLCNDSAGDGPDSSERCLSCSWTRLWTCPSVCNGSC